MSAGSSINLMIVDDSRVIRNSLKDIIGQDPSIKLIAEAANGQEAVDQLSSNRSIDVILLDIQMPVMDGLEAIPLLLKIKPKVKIIIVSSLSARGAKITLDALSLGATDYIEKLKSKENLEKFKVDLLLKIHILGKVIDDVKRPILSDNESEITLKEMPKDFKPSIIAIASSTGGPKALIDVLDGLSQGFLSNNIIIITQHIKNDFVDLLVSNINDIGKINCKKAEDNEILKKGIVYLAPSNSHLEVQRKNDNLVVHLSDEPPENFCRPSADPMFASLAKLSLKILAIVLTGIGKDGLRGAENLADKDNVIIAQNKETSVVWGMPGSVARAGICSAILPLNKIASFIEKGV